LGQGKRILATKKYMKGLLQSKTFWIAVIQAVIGIITVFSGAYPSIGELLIAKSVLDVIMRAVTGQQIVGWARR